VRSPFLTSANDPQIEQQLNAAFGGRVPPGEVCLLRLTEGLNALQIRGSSETINPMDRRKVSCFHTRCDPSRWSPPRRRGDRQRAYQVAIEDVKSRCFLKWNEDRSECEIGGVESKCALKALSKKDMEEEAATATPVPEKAVAQKQHSPNWVSSG
jgi:hypothetical protein